MPICRLVPDVNVLLALDPAEVGAVMLEYMNGIPARDNPLGNVYIGTCTTGDNLEAYPRETHDAAERALAEGWMWLEKEGLVARKPDDVSGIWFFVTRRGRRLRTRADVESYRRAAEFPKRMLHPLIAVKSEPPFMRGEYDSAVFHAFKEVEVAVRAAGGYDEGDFGTDLMRKAFHDSTGPLRDPNRQLPERQALAHLFAGAIGSYKNPHSHRNVAIGAKEAIEMIVLASHLLSIVETRKVVLSSAGRA